MAAVTRLRRMGTNKRPFYRIVVTDSRKARNSSYIESVGYYNPIKNPPEINVNAQKMHAWFKKGAKFSITVEKILKMSSNLRKVKDGIGLTGSNVDATTQTPTETQEQV